MEDETQKAFDEFRIDMFKNHSILMETDISTVSKEQWARIIGEAFVAGAAHGLNLAKSIVRGTK